MLINLHIENYVLIDRLDLQFDKGFSVITGETGAGKSILLGALSLILGDRSKSNIVKEGEKKCIVEAIFDISEYNMEFFFKDNDLDYYAKECIIRREVSLVGKSRNFINDTPVSLTLLRKLSVKLVDIHSQHKNLLIGDNVYQLSLMDAVAENSSIKSEYKKIYLEYVATKKRYATIVNNTKKIKEEEELLNFQFNELQEAKLLQGEDQELEDTIKTLSNANQIKDSLYKIFGYLDNNESGINSLLNNCVSEGTRVNNYLKSFDNSLKRLDSARIDLSDLSSEIEVLMNDIEVNPEKLNYCNERLDLLYSLENKYSAKSSLELIEIRDSIKEKISNVGDFDSNLEKLKIEVDLLAKRLKDIGKKLTTSRKDVISTLETKLISMLQFLGMKNSVFKIKIISKEYCESGCDEIAFLFSSDKNRSLQSIEKIASGGEISRIMLCLKSIMAEKIEMPTILFDEIDTGVSGEIAHKMSEIMLSIAKKRQVISITHLPQVAAKGNLHYKVYKKENNEGIITTFVKSLNKEERVMEIAQMLSGAKITDAAIKNSQTLLLEK